MSRFPKFKPTAHMNNEKDFDMVHNPSHYQFPRPAEEMADLTITMPHALGSAMEYLYRAGKKVGADATEDLQKAVWWIKREIAEREVRALCPEKV